MSRLRTLVAAIGSTAVITGMTTVGVSGTAQASPTPARVTLAGSAAPFTGHTAAVGDVAGSQQLSVELWLKPNLAAAQRFADAASTPGTTAFRHYLSPAAYTARFGPTAAQAATVAAWLHSQGFTSIRTDSQRSYVRASAPVSTINAAFHVTLKLYKASAQVNAGPYRLRANDRPVSLPASVASAVLGVTGLVNASPLMTLERTHRVKNSPTGPSTTPTAVCSQYYGQNSVSGLPAHFGTTTFPVSVCGYSAGQLRSAYGANTANVGKGQTIALVELGLANKMFLTLQDYAKTNSMPAPATTHYAELSLGQGSACGDAFAVEEQLDVEVSYDMAPGANQLVVGGDSCDSGDYGLQGLFNADTAILDGNGNHPLASVASNSWESGTEGQPALLTNIEHAYLVRAVAEGVGMYFSSGDGSGVLSPSSDSDAVAVGGTSLGIGLAGNRLFETGWSTGVTLDTGTKWQFNFEDGAAGGGPSLLWTQPQYQKGVVPASMSSTGGNHNTPERSVPDISADADLFTGMAVGLLEPINHKLTYVQIDVGGTSVAAPLVAGMVTAAQQGQPMPFGFTDPTLYKLFGSSAFNDTLPVTSSTAAADRGALCPTAFQCSNVPLLAMFDQQTQQMLGYNGQVTAKGYDNMTGVGSPNGQDFISALRTMK
ncbi:MAG TPA: protease pro-enzyme activation domain-containing protein [Streptosporangiaceae bacterium]|nr:protease pro-enzyme activation domain-containing protein [Streptosporangiaceae bacterium]